METLVQPQLFFDDGHQHVNRECHPHLRLHGVLGSAVESSDVQVLFDPAEEQFYLPTCPVQLGDGERKKEKNVGQEGQSELLVGIVVGDAARMG